MPQHTTQELLEMPREQAVVAFDPWLHHVANALRPWSHPLHDDIVQEGRIAVWRAFETFDYKRPSLPSWLTRCAKARMLDIAYERKPQFGHVALRGHWEPKSDRMDALELLLTAPMVPQDLVVDRTMQPVLDRVISSYHRGEVLEAVAQLNAEQREYVVRRFWGGVEPRGPRPTDRAGIQAWREQPEVAESLGVPDHAPWEPAKQILAAELEDYAWTVRDGYGDEEY